MTEHPGEQFPPDVDPDVEPGFEPYPSEESPNEPDYDTEPGPQNTSYAEQSAEGDTEAAFEASLDEPTGTGYGEAAAEQVDTPADESAGDEHAHVDPAEVEFGPEFARAPGQEHEHSFIAESAEDPAPQDEPVDPAPRDEPEDPAPQDEEQGHPLVEETMGRLGELRERPVSEHAEVYADLHERLQSALVEADAEHSDRA